MALEDLLKNSARIREEALKKGKGQFYKTRPVEDATETENEMIAEEAIVEPVDKENPEEIGIISPERIENVTESENVIEKPQDLPSIKESDPIEDNLLKNLKIARDQYASVKFNETRLLNRIRKALGKSSDGNGSETPNILSVKDVYDRSLREYKEYKINKFKEEIGKPDAKSPEEQMKELFTFFNYTEAVEFYDAKTEAIRKYHIDEYNGNGNFIEKAYHAGALGSEDVANKYKKLPATVKFAIAGAAFLPGMQMMAVGKRAWGAFMIAASAGMQIDKLASFVDKFSNSNELKKMFDAVSLKDEKEQKFDILSNILDEKIAGIDEKLSKQIKRSQINKGIAFASAAFLGVSTILNISQICEGSENAKKAISGLLEKFWPKGDVHEVSITAAVPPVQEPTAATTDITKNLDPKSFKLRDPLTGKTSYEETKSPSFGNNAGQDANVGANLTQGAPTHELPAGHAAIKPETSATGAQGATENVKAAPSVSKPAAAPKFDSVTPSGALNETEQAAHVKEVAAEAAKAAEAKASADVPLTIEKGSSIERTLIDHIKKVHPDIKNPGNAAHRMWLDYMDDNKKDIIAKVGDAEYQKMLKDGMVNVKPGTVLMIDEHEPLRLKLENIGGKISHLNGHGHAPLHAPSHVPAHGVADAPTNETYNEWNKDVTRSAIENAAAEKEKYDIASAIARHEVPNLNPNSPNYADNLKYTETLQKAAASDLYNWGPSYEVGRLGELMKHSREHMQSLLDMPDKQTFTKIGKDFFDNKKSNILKFGGMNVREALNNPDENLKGLSAKAKKLIIGYANSDVTKPKPNETFKVWSYRIMTLARGASAQKLAA